jgi:lysophospholipase L1-like esterase
MRRLTAVVLAAAATAMFSPAPAQAGAAADRAAAGPATRPTAMIGMGESYFAGNAGRWAGNTLADTGSRNGTDRAYRTALGGSDPHLVYGATYDNGCLRSDVAPILSASVNVDEKINLSCSGATAENVFRAVSGGVPWRGEQPQADQLAAVAATHDVKMVVLNLGGNDLGFGDAIVACIAGYEVTYSFCKDGRQAAIESRIPAAKAAVGKAIDEIRAVLTAAGQPAARIVLTTYPAPLPRAADNRYPESGLDRTLVGGCPMWDGDLDWARDILVPRISDVLTQVAASRNVQLLDMRDALSGHEICAKAASQVGTAGPDGRYHEWAYWTDLDGNPGEIAETLHPNFFGQRAWGRCIGLVFATTGGNHRCVNAGPGGTETQMSLVPASPPLGPDLALHRPVAVSSVQFGTLLYGDKAVDGDLGTRWGSKFADPQWIRVDLGAVRPISQVRLFWEAAFAKAYRIDVSDDATAWHTVFTTTAGNGGVDRVTFPPGITGRYVRMFGTERGTDNGFSLWSLEVF